LGAHIGHMHVEAYHCLSNYVLGTRHYFTVFDLKKTVPMLKKAILFLEQLISNFGHALFCYSGISVLNPSIKLFLSNIIKERNQSFSY